MRKITLRLGNRSYQIITGRNLLSSLGDLLRPLKLGSKILIVSNRRIAKEFLKTEFELVKNSLIRSGYELSTPYLFRYGNERDKSKETLFRLWEHMAQVGLERSSSVLAFGGGVVGDVAGFAASTYMRGISLIQVPTTLLAQVDASIGGKTAIDLPSAKNLVGTFYQPRLVLADVGTLRKLAQFRMREFQNSLAEVIKTGMIQDPKLFEVLEGKIAWFLSFLKQGIFGPREISFLEDIVWRSQKVKAKIVEEDEWETKGKRMILNYGHTFGHAFEAATNYGFPHGEAVALGMACEARLAVRLGLFRKEDERRQNRLIERAGLATRFENSRFDFKRVLSPMLLDKKKKEGRLRFVLPVAIGRVRIVEGISLSLVKRVLSDLEGK